MSQSPKSAAAPELSDALSAATEEYRRSVGEQMDVMRRKATAVTHKAVAYKQRTSGSIAAVKLPPK